MLQALMNPEDTRLSEVSQSPKDKYCMIPLIRKPRVIKFIETESRMFVAMVGGTEGSRNGELLFNR